MTVTKTYDGKRYHYYADGKLYRSGKRDYRYCCIATSRETGRAWPVSLGNNRESTYRSMAYIYAWQCDMEVVEIQTI